MDEAKSKAKLIDQRAEESRKDLEKVVTTAIKQESEKVRFPLSSISALDGCLFNYIQFESTDQICLLQYLSFVVLRLRL